jgi:hypothetical protein
VICRYETRIVAACPVDDRPDVYDVTFEAAGTIPCEEIVAAVARFADRKVYQEDITAGLARDLRCKVTTVGFHSGIKTTVIAP